MNQNIIKQLLKDWKIVLSNRYELLNSLQDKDLDFLIKGRDKHEDIQSQFATIGGTYRAYIELLKLKKFEDKYFTVLEKELTTVRTISGLEQILKDIDARFENEVLKHEDDEEFNWGPVTTPIWRIIVSAIEMERLCHGQLVCYFALANLALPPNFKKQWGMDKPLK